MTTSTELPELLTVKRAARELGMSKCSIYRWVKRGWLAYIRLPNGTIRIPRTAIIVVLGTAVSKMLAGK